MPKVSKVGKFRKTAAAAVAETKIAAIALKNNATTSMSRGQRKRQEKKDQYLKRQKLISSCLSLKKQDEQKKRIDGLDALKEALKGTVSEEAEHPKEEVTQKPNLLITNESKKKLTIQEVSHMGLVLQHPDFQANPFATIQQHLKNTLAPQARQLKKESEIRAKALEVEAERRKKDKKEKLLEGEGKYRKKRRKKCHAARRSKT
eukprot:CAMPEP_0194145928 /NCGR_PEP_ID=MMETSP0152-20130528/18918_1 /TAXON_ID=1049557 /ORGANISM="Thalassiothrix antarctica, Strain L6-D1" /LENGTH=203 /DNA_ID=CAMNT_0038846299 /DNA_START=17 /DNA_END=628 /DNA_ORIENTATION=+